MSTDYTQTLKTIKEAEEASAKGIADKKKLLSDQLQSAQEQADKNVTDAKAAAESFVSQEVDKAKAVGEADAKKLVDATEREAERVAEKKLRTAEFKKIIEEILLPEFQGA